MLNSQCLGWVDIDAFKTTTTPSKQAQAGQQIQQEKFLKRQFKKGSTREILSTNFLQVALTSYQVYYSLETHEALQPLFRYIPDSVLVSTEDYVPGVVSDHLSNSPHEISVRVLPYDSIFISRIKFYLPENVEFEVKNQMTKYAQQLGQGVCHANLRDKYFVASFHNGWTTVNSRGMDNRQGLKSGKVELRAMGKSQSQVNCLTYEYIGQHEVDYVFSNDMTVLVLQLEYEIEVIKGNNDRNVVKRALGWLPIHINSQLEDKSVLKIEDVLMKGPGSTIDQQKLVEIGRQEENCIFMEVDISMNKLSAQQAVLHMQMQQDREYLAQEQQPRSEGIQRGQKKVVFADQVMGGQDRQQPTTEQDVDRIKQLAIINKQQRDLDDLMKKYEQLKSEQMPKGHRPDNLAFQELRSMQDSQKFKTAEEAEHIIADLKRNIMILSARIDKLQQEKQLAELNVAKEVEQILRRQGGTIPVVAESKDVPTLVEDNKSKSVFAEDRRRFLLEQNEMVRHEVLPNVTEKEFMENSYIGIRELTKVDKSRLMKYNINGLLDAYRISPTFTPSDLRMELQDYLKTNVINISFLSIKPIVLEFASRPQDQSLPVMQNLNPYAQGGAGSQQNHYINQIQLQSQIKSIQEKEKEPDFHFPSKLYITYNFFDFPTQNTGVLTYEGAEDQNLVKDYIRNSMTCYLRQYVKDKDSQVTNVFCVDPSVAPHIGIHEDFIRYLFYQTLQMNVWDYDRQMLYGFVRIPLNLFLRRRQQ